MDSQNYKQAVTEMYAAMQEVFAANEKLQRLTQVVWDWDRTAPLPPSPPSEHEYEVEDDAEREEAAFLAEKEDLTTDPISCGCKSTFWTPCVHECSICLKALTLKDGEGLCWMCEEDLVTVAKEWPEDAAEAKEYSLYGEGAYHALMLRIRANNCREAADDTDDAEEVDKCLEEAKSLDARASDLLYNKAGSRFKPWWFASWDYWMMPGSTHKVPAWAACEKPVPVAHLLSPEVLAAPPANPCSDCPVKNGFHEGICRSMVDWQALWREAAAEPVPYEQSEPQPEPEVKVKPDYNHKFWPSPRPKLFAKACAPERKFTSHQNALEFLASKAGITVADLLEMEPRTYIQKHMGNKAPNCWDRINARRWGYF